MITYEKLDALCKSKGTSITLMRKEGIISSTTALKLRDPVKSLSTYSINKICAYLDCQPGEFMTYTKD